MKKTFPLTNPTQDAARVLEAVKLDVRKYLKRERRKTVPEGFARWQFDCRVGAEAAAAVPADVNTIIEAIEAVAHSGAPSVYVEILATPALRPARPDSAEADPQA